MRNLIKYIISDIDARTNINTRKFDFWMGVLGWAYTGTIVSVMGIIAGVLFNNPTLGGFSIAGSIISAGFYLFADRKTDDLL